MIITFTGDPRRTKNDKPEHNPDYTAIGGMQFTLNEPVEVPDHTEWAKRFGPKLRNNSHFTVEDGIPADLLDRAKAAGVKVDKRWTEKTLREKVEAAESG